jgi:tungstate transport system substrate-binding protein
VPATSGLLNTLLPDFEQQTGYQVQVSIKSQDIYDFARTGAADLVISHYGFSDLEPFVLDGLGMWPRPIFASQAVIIGPPDDPANIRDLTDASEAFRRIAATQSLYIVNNDPNVKYATSVLWEGSGPPDQTGWYSDTGLEGNDAADSVAGLGGYMIWGVDPFLQYQKTHNLPVDILVAGDSILQRVMAAVVVTPKTSPSVNLAGAEALRDYLISPAVQARVRSFCYSSINRQFWWPAGQNNDASPSRGAQATGAPTSTGSPMADHVRQSRVTHER